MSKQAFELLDLESGYKYTLETSTDILPSDFNLVLPDRNGTLALTKDVDDLSGKLVRGDIVVGDSKKLDGKALSEIALSDMSNVTLTPEMVDSLRGFTGSAGAQGPMGPTGPQGPAGTGAGGSNNNVIDLYGQRVDLSQGTYFKANAMDIGGLLFMGPVPNPSGQTNSFVLELQDGGMMTFWWDAMGYVQWANGTAPTLTYPGTDLLAFITTDGGMTWKGLVLGKDIR